MANIGAAITPPDDRANPLLPPRDQPPGVPFEQKGDVDLTKRKKDKPENGPPPNE
jgi:hypothetical protein